MSRSGRSYSKEFKAKVALEAVKNDRTLVNVAQEFKLHPNVVGNWKKQLLENLPDLFIHKQQKNENRDQELIDKLYQQIGRLQVELDWLKKKHNSLY